MTPPEHLLIGITCANIFYSILGIFRKHWFNYFAFALVLGLVAMAPDIDSFFGHYTSQDPVVGHRGMTHSFLGVAVIALPMVLSASFGNLLARAFVAYWKLLVRFFRKRFGLAQKEERRSGSTPWGPCSLTAS